VEKSDLIWMNGDFVPWDEANVHVLSHGLHYGTGVFEGVRAYDTELGTAVFRHREHLARLARSAAFYELELPYDLETLREATLELIRRNRLDSCYIRPLAFRGYGEMGLNARSAPVEVIIAAWPWGTYLGEEGKLNGIRAKISTWRRHSPDSVETRAKASGHYLNSILAKQDSVKTGYDEAIMLDQRGMVSEGSGENIFIVQDGVVVTPAQGFGILVGITRASVIQIARDLGYTVVERDVAPAELYEADEVFVTGTAAELVPVREIDQHTFAAPGEITAQLLAKFEDALHGRASEYVEWLDVVEQPSKVTS
jgi:branched-chain amino acid aminotransferase